MSVSFDTTIKVFADDATLCGDIEMKEQAIDGFTGWAFVPCNEVPLTADELRAIADKLDELNWAKRPEGGE